jgi:hypothetical protein
MPKREEPAAEEQKPVITRPRREETEPEQHEETTEHTGNVVFTEVEGQRACRLGSYTYIVSS